jgi:hypothetical protein
MAELASDTIAVPQELPDLRFQLPGVWSQVPLHDEEEARKAVRALVARQLGTADDRATMRNDLRRQLMSALAEAIAGEGQSMQVALDIVEGLPIPASFTVFLPSQALTPAVGTDASAVIEILESGLAESDSVDHDTIVRFTVGPSEVLRTSRLQEVPTEEGQDDLTVLVVDYWMTIPGTKRFILISFHTALAEAATEMTVLFDSIVKASYWHSPQS